MANITKIYDIKLQGEKDLVTKMQSVNKQFDDAKKRFKDLKAIISAGGLSTGDMAKYREELAASKIETEKLRQETIRLNNEGKALTNTNRIQREEQRKVKQEAKLTVSEYQNLINEHVKLKNNAKELGATLGIDSQEFIKASEKANKYGENLQKIRYQLKEFQSNVGNYPKDINVGGVSSGVFNQLKNAGLGDILGNQVDQTKGKVIQLNSEFAEMKKKLNDAKNAGVKDLDELEKKIIHNRVEAEKLNAEFKEGQTHLNGLGSVGSGIFGGMTADVKSLIIGYVGLYAAMNAVTGLIGDTKELADQTTNLEVELGKTAGGAKELVDELAKLDTRTKLVILEEIANIATKAGTSEANLLGVTQAIDKIKTSFGKDFGDVETGTETFAKLINIFYDDREITGERILKIGNAIRTLANETVASVPFINDFNGRMAGLRQIFTNFELSQSIGLGAGFEEFKQSAEVSSTALVKILPKLAADTEKFAKILGIPQAEFKKLINDNPAEALIQVSEKLVKSGKGVEEIANSFADAELGAGRVTTILGTLGGKADVFRERIKRAGETIQSTTNIEESFNRKNENLAGVLDKVSKRFSDMANNQNFVKFISIAGTAVLALISAVTGIPFGWWIGMVTFLTLAYWENVAAIFASTGATWAKITAKTQEIILTATANALIITGTVLEYAQAVATGVLTAAKWLLVAALNASGVSTLALQRAYLFLNTTFLATPIGWLVIGILAVSAVTSAYGSEVDKTANSLKKQGEQLKTNAAQIRVNAEIEKRATEATSERLAKIIVLSKVAGDLTANDTARKKALEELIAIDSKYQTALDGNIIRTDKLNQITKELTASIKEQAKAEAAKTLMIEKQKKLLDNEAEIGRLGVRAEKQKKEGFFKIVGRDRGLFEEAATNKIENLEEQNNLLKDDINALADKLGKTIIDNAGKNGGSDTTTPGGKDDKTKASKLTGEQKDYLRDINALREAELSELKKQKLEGTLVEEEYLKKSLATNIKYNDKILDHFKGTDAVTRKLRADTASDSIDKTIETNEKLFKIQEDALNQTLSNQNAIAQARLDVVADDPNSTPLERAQAEKVYYEELLNNQVDFNSKMDVLETQLKIKSQKNAEDRKNLILKEQSDLNKKTYQLSKAQFDSLITGTKDFEEYRKNSIAIEASKKRMMVMNDKSLTQEEKQHAIEKINAAETLANINAELGAVNAQVKFYEDRRAVQKLNNEELQKYNELLKTKQLLEEKKGAAETEVKIKGTVEIALPSADSLQKKIQALFSDVNGKFIIGKDEQGNDIDGSQMLGGVISQAFDIAAQSMNNYFEAEKLAVEKSKQLAYERIDIEKRQLLFLAQSESERDSIEKRALEKKKLADKEAGERLKKIKKNEAKIALATELANIWSSVWSTGNPYVAIALGAVMTGLALVRYSNNVKAINQAQYGKGGLFGRGGKLSGPSHSQNNGMPVVNPETGEPQAYLEGKEGIINKNSMNDTNTYSVSGTPSQIASKINSIGGGVDWAGGASLAKYKNGGAYIGSNVQPPIFKSYYNNRYSSVDNPDNNQMNLQEVKDLLIETNIALNREVNRKTYISSREMSTAQKENNKQSEIATL